MFNNFLKSKEYSKTISERKILVLGNSGAGKTSLLKRITSSEFNLQEAPTRGMDCLDVELKGKSQKLVFWDTIKVAEGTQITWRNTDAILICIDLTNKDSLNALQTYLQMIKDKNLSNVPIIVCGTKADLKNKLIINKEAVEEVIKKENMEDITYVVTSAKDNTNINTLWTDLEKKMEPKKDEKEIHTNNVSQQSSQSSFLDSAKQFEIKKQNQLKLVQVSNYTFERSGNIIRIAKKIETNEAKVDEIIQQILRAITNKDPDARVEGQDSGWLVVVDNKEYEVPEGVFKVFCNIHTEYSKEPLDQETNELGNRIFKEFAKRERDPSFGRSKVTQEFYGKMVLPEIGEMIKGKADTIMGILKQDSGREPSEKQFSFTCGLAFFGNSQKTQDHRRVWFQQALGKVLGIESISKNTQLPKFKNLDTDEEKQKQKQKQIMLLLYTLMLSNKDDGLKEKVTKLFADQGISRKQLTQAIRHELTTNHGLSTKQIKAAMGTINTAVDKSEKTSTRNESYTDTAKNINGALEDGEIKGLSFFAK